MEFESRKQIKDKAQYTYGLLNVLKCDIDILRKNANDFNLDKLKDSIQDTDITLQKLLLVVEEIKYILDLDEMEGP